MVTVVPTLTTSFFYFNLANQVLAFGVYWIPGRMGWPRCCVPGCGENKKLRFRFPHPYSDRHKRFGEWLRRIGDRDLMEMDAMKVYENRRICFRHFTIGDYIEGTHYLRKDALPSRFPRAPAVAVCNPNVGVAEVVGASTSHEHDASVEVDAPETEVLCPATPPNTMPPSPTFGSETPTSSFDTPMSLPSTSKEVQRSSKREGVLLGIGVRKAKSLTPKAKSLYKINKLLKRAVSRSSKKLISFKQRLQAAEEGLNRGVGFIDNLPQTVSNFLQCQVTQYQKKNKGRRFPLDYKVWSLALLKRSGRAYDFLSKVFILPSRRTLLRLLSRLSFSTGIDNAMFNHLSVVVKKKVKTKDKHCILMFDEMALTPHLDFHEHLDYIEGFVDLGGGKRSRAFADKALVYMVRGLNRKYKQPVAYVFHSGSANTLALSQLLSDVIGRVLDCGLTVHATICDQAPTNCSLVNILCENTKAAVLRRGEDYRGDYFCVNGMKIIPLFDPPHLLKGIRNGLLTKDLKFSLQGVSGIASWRHVLQAYYMDCGKKRNLPKLSDFHVVPEKIKKMKVKYCTQVFSDRLSLVMRLSSAIPGSGVEPQAADTSELLSFFDQLFDSVNGRWRAPPPEKPLLCAVSSSSGHMEFWAEAIQALESMEYTCSGKDLTSKERRPPSLVNWVRTLRNIRDLWVNLRRQGMNHLILRNLNQDPLENKFGCIRSYGFRNNSPTCTNFVGAYKSLILNDMVASHSVGANCEEDDCEVLDNLKNYLFPSVSSGPSTSSLPGSIDNTDCEGVINEPMAFTAPSTVDSTISDKSDGDLLSKLGSFQCAECVSKQSATARDPSFQGRISPSKKFSDTYKLATTLIYKYLPDLAHQLGVGSILRSRLQSCIDFQHLACDEHYVNFGQKFCRHVVNTTVVAWCNSVNSYLSGKRCKPTEAMDVIHTLALEYFRKKRGGKY